MDLRKINDKSKPVVRQASFSVLELATLQRSIRTYVGLQAFIYMPDIIQVLDFIHLAERCLIVFCIQTYWLCEIDRS